MRDIDKIIIHCSATPPDMHVDAERIDSWHKENKGNKLDLVKYKKFLKEIGYLIDEGPDFKIEQHPSVVAE